MKTIRRTNYKDLLSTEFQKALSRILDEYFSNVTFELSEPNGATGAYLLYSFYDKFATHEEIHLVIADYDGDGDGGISISLFSDDDEHYAELSFSEERDPNIWVEKTLGANDKWESLPRKIMSALIDVSEKMDD